MKSSLSPSLLLAATFALGFATVVRGQATTNTLKFSDPSKPATVKISVGRGDLRIRGIEGDAVTVKSEAQPEGTRRTKDGLRVISSSAGFSFSEKDNVITIDAGSEWHGRGRADFEVEVPRNTSVVIQNSFGGDIACTGLNGDIEINSMHGEIQLEDVAGGIVVSTMNGEIEASIRELREGKPLSFTSMNGEVQIRVPENARANVRLRTQNGAVLTDFEETALVTRTEATSGPARAHLFRSGNAKVLSAEVEDAIREAARISATAVQEALEAVKRGLDESRMGMDEAKRQLEAARQEMDRARDNRERRADAIAPGAPKPQPPRVAVPKPPTPPKIASFTVSGGKLVTGTLNGGGPEINVSTMNGDVVLRKLPTKN